MMMEGAALSAPIIFMSDGWPFQGELNFLPW
jgi:hypothetical protein